MKVSVFQATMEGHNMVNKMKMNPKTERLTGIKGVWMQINHFN